VIEVKVEENIIGAVMCVRKLGVGNIIVYFDVFLRYRLREILLCRLMFSDVNCVRNYIVYSDGV